MDLASKGINYLLNVGPTAKGEIPAPSVARLREIGRWMRANGESIYGTSASPFPYEQPWGRMTQKPGLLYLHLFEWPRGALAIHGLKNRVGRAYLLRDPGRTLEMTQRRDAATGISILTLSGFGKRPDPHVSVVVLEIDGGARVEEMPVQQPDNSVLLPAFMARCLGPTKGGFAVSRSGFTERWTSTATGLAWTAKILEPGRFRLSVLSSDNARCRGSGRKDAHRLHVSVGSPLRAQPSFPLVKHELVSSPRAQYFPEIATRAGEVVIPAAGICAVELRADRVSVHAADGIGVSGVRLELVGARED